MWRFLIIVLLPGTSLISALDLTYLDPTKLQTVSTSQTQQSAAIKIITKYLRPEVVDVEIDTQYFQDKKDSFSLNLIDGKLHIKASTGVAAVWGFNYYLKKYCKSQVEWQTRNVRIPDQLPYVNETVISNDRFRYYQNVCTVSYSFVWWKFEDWKQHVEWMALNGINLALAPVAQEAAWTKIYRQLGLTQEEIDQYMTGPAFLSWFRMGNVHGWAGPLPQSWHDLQILLQKNVTSMMIELGIVPVLPAFNGHVPKAIVRVYPNSTFHRVTNWMVFNTEYCCGFFVDPNDPLFHTIGKQFLDEIKTPGVHIYTADPFNEISISEFSTTFAEDTAFSIIHTLMTFDRNAVWLLQNWMFVNSAGMWPRTRVQHFIKAVPNGRMLILDLQAEQWPQYDIYEMYYGQPFIWCMLHNFGGNLGMFGNMVTISRDVYEVRSLVNSTMIGVGLTPEGINQNYVVYDLMLESAWRKSPVEDLNAWVADYAERRYGCNETAEAWKHLLKSVYSFNGSQRLDGQYLITQRPGFGFKPWAWYQSYDLFQAFKKLVFVKGNCNTEGYRYDVVDVTRQALQYRAEQIYINVVNDRKSNVFVFESSINRYLSVLSDMIDILDKSDYFRASEFFYKASQIGTSADESYLYEMNARNQITLWGPRGEISDYACKQWVEIFRDYYRPRWQLFLSAALQSKKSGEIFDEDGTRRVINNDIEVPFYVNTGGYSRWSHGYSGQVTLEMAQELYKKWAYVADSDLPIRR